MRRALDGNPPITTYHGEAGYGYFGKHAGYDYGIVRWAVRAPEAGVILNVWLGREAVNGGNIIEMQGQYTHRFLHLQSSSVSVGQTVVEGQELGITGNTGNVGFHLHHDIRKNGTKWTDSYSNYIDWEQLIKSNQGEQKMTPQEEANAYRIVLGRTMEHGGSGRTGYKFITDAEPEVNGYRNNVNAMIANLQTALANEQAKPPKEIVKEVQVIVEKLVEVEKPVEVIKIVDPTWYTQLKEFIDRLVNKFKKGQ